MYDANTPPQTTDAPSTRNTQIRYCARCVLPDNKPGLELDADGVCNACRNYENRTQIDWDCRQAELKQIIETYRSKSRSNYDCIIPVSGGKDSTFQVLKMLEAGANPLCVTATTDKLSEYGRHNLENIKELGVDHIQVSTNPIVRRKINRLALTQVGDISWPEHLTIFTVPVRMAVQLNIPLIIWGENSQNEYGGPAATADNNVLDRKWLNEFGGLLGFQVTDLIGQEGITEKDLIQYTYPTDEELRRVGVTGLFLGYYFPWDGHNNALLAQAYGFRAYEKRVEGSIVPYENLDNLQMRIHDYFKFLKFGYDRCNDWASIHIRRNRLSRAQGVELVGRHGGKFPHTYLGCGIEEVLDDIDMTMEEFVRVCDQFTNTDLFETNDQGKLIRDRFGNLSPRFPVV